MLSGLYLTTQYHQYGDTKTHLGRWLVVRILVEVVRISITITSIVNADKVMIFQT
jgi:hypothetical protein